MKLRTLHTCNAQLLCQHQHSFHLRADHQNLGRKLFGQKIDQPVGTAFGRFILEFVGMQFALGKSGYSLACIAKHQTSCPMPVDQLADQLLSQITDCQSCAVSQSFAFSIAKWFTKQFL